MCAGQVVAVQVERLASIVHLRDALPIAELDVSCFGCPAGWVEERDESSRRRKKKWMQLDPQSGVDFLMLV